MASNAIGQWPNQDFVAQAETGAADGPRNNPCAQCGQPIPFPDWVETSGHRTAYLWQCSACGYRFEATAFFAEHGTANGLAA